MDARPPRILVPVDFSACSVHALAFAVAWDHAKPCELHLLHVVEDGTRDPMTGEVAYSLEELRRAVERELYRFADPRAGAARLATIGRHVAVGAAADQILRAATRLGIDLIVMGSEGAGGVTSLLLGSVASKVVRRAGCPVLTVRPTTPPTATSGWRRIVCPVDFSEPARAAMLAACALASQLGVELLLLHAVPAPAAPTAAERERLGAALARWKAQAEAAGAGEVTTALTHGPPGDTIVGFVRDDGSDLLVLGTHGRGGIFTLLLGSVARTVLVRAPCAIVTVHPPATEDLVANEAAP